MEAKEMFEKLGYANVMKTNAIIIYQKPANESEITFYEGYNFIGWEIQFHCDRTFSKQGIGYRVLGWINQLEHKAIQKQIEELGW